jgi:octaprenyl-diphosphate synthase
MNPQLAAQPLVSPLSMAQSLVAGELAQCERIFQAELAHASPHVDQLLAHLSRYRGKRLRPMLVLLVGRACGSLDEGHAVLAASIEMIHTATLVHDDILDNASQRRHVETVNSRWGSHVSVLLGDYLFTHAFHLASQLGDAAVCRALGRATNRVCVGELTQVFESGNLDLPEETYLDIIDGKTAELCAVACELAARRSGMSASICQSLDAYGRSLGAAFQIADDLLDLVGTEARVGKTLGSDVQNGKLTLPLIHLLTTGRDEDRKQARSLLAHPTRSSPGSLLQLLRDNRSLEYAQARAGELIVAARLHLQSLPASAARQVLEDLAEFVVARNN